MSVDAGSSGSAQTRHKKTPSAVLKSIVSTRAEKAQPSTNSSPTKKNFEVTPISGPSHRPNYLPLGEIQHNRERKGPKQQGPTQIHLTGMEKPTLAHQRSRSEISFKGLRRDRNKSTEDVSKTTSKADRLKKTKSSTNFSAFLGKSKASKTNNKGIGDGSKNKENRPPLQSVVTAPTPIFAEFSSPQNQQPTRVTKVPLNDTWSIEDEAQRYTPQDYSPSKGRNFFDELPSLTSAKQEWAPPKMGKLEKTPIHSQPSGAFGRLRKTSSSKSFKEDKSKVADPKEAKSNPTSRPTTADENRTGKGNSTFKGGSRVRAAVAAISGKAKEAPPTPKESKPNPIDIESAFEKILESQNIAPDVRKKMRALDISVKAGLMKQDSSNIISGEGGNSSSSRTSSRPGTATHVGKKDSSSPTKKESPDSQEQSGKKPRPRSLNFTLSKGDSSPSKKQKSRNGTSHSRHKSVEIPRTASSTSLNSIASSSSFSIFGKSQKFVVPNDFISYLRKNLKPQQVEVGKIQKLRQLLRNETVTWVDTFISDGGMTELVSLLYRIVEMQWREDHEDNLLHHTLTCLKALTTTSSAMKQLDGLQAKLFPTLLELLYSSGEEKKGPSEFTTRGLIISLLFASISASPTAQRAKELLSYLKDPTPKNKTQPLGFIADMHRPRPYKLWCTEINNVAKEVFWIFLHSVNVIPFPATASSGTNYCNTHFPEPRPPVPAAPYVGSVEWDATMYLAIHLDLLNGVLASLATAEDRNALRTELRDSGFERVMGGQLRLCKEKFYGHVHAGLSTWAGAARADGWDSKDVREGPKDEVRKRAKSASPMKKKADKAPVLDMPKLDFEIRGPMTPMQDGKGGQDLDGWI